MEARFVIATGGTGGHVYPALAVAEVLKERGYSVLIIAGGTKFSVAMPPNTVRIRSGHFQGISIHSVKAFLNLVRGIKQSFRILNSEKEKGKVKLIATGSYATLPVLLATRLMGIDYYLLEQNFIPGTVTKLFAKGAKAVFTSFEGTSRYLEGANVLLTGNPLRKNVLLRVPQNEAKAFFGIPEDRKVVLVIGGSLGARKVASTALEVAKRMKDLFFLVQAGRSHFAELLRQFGDEGDNFVLVPYIDKMHIAYSAADIVISRAGGGAIAELACFSIPSILIPFPSAKHNHQFYNAKALADRNAALLLLDSELTPDTLQKLIEKILRDAPLVAEMRRNLASFARPDASIKIVEKVTGAL